MKARRILTGLIALAVLGMALAAKPALAQDPTGRAAAAPLAPMGTAFTYQGQLIKNGEPVNGTCDFLFILYDAQTGDTLCDHEDKPNVTVTGGLFTVPNLDFGSVIFTGAARWLEVWVRYPAGSGSYVSIGSRQELTPTPYALHAGHATLANAAPWSGLIGVPDGFADDVDNDTLYTTDYTLRLTGTQLGIAPTYQLPQGCEYCTRRPDRLSRRDGPAGDDCGSDAVGGPVSTAPTTTTTWRLQGLTSPARSGRRIPPMNAGADLELAMHSNDEVVVHLDDDNNSGSSFTV